MGKNIGKNIRKCKQQIQPKTTETTDDLIGNKIANKITKKKNSPQYILETVESIYCETERYISPEERQQIIHELRLI